VWSQAGLVERTRLDKGLVSNVVRQLERDGHVKRDSADNSIQVVDPNLLLDAWREEYDFSRHTIEHGVVPARSGRDLLVRMAEHLGKDKIRFAATGLAGASLLAPFADFRTVSLYVDRLPEARLKEELHFREGRSGSNLWLVVPNDIGVFDGEERISGIPAVSPVQCYLDLSAQPERAEDAARELREKRLPFRAESKTKAEMTPPALTS
jgi:hypothetical protein